MRTVSLLFLASLALLGCGTASLDGKWIGSTGPKGFDIEMELNGNNVSIDFSSKVTTAKLKAEGTYKADGETLTTIIDTAKIDEASLTGYMKELANDKSVKEATEKATVDLLSKQLSGAYKVDGKSLKIYGNPTDLTLTKKP